MHRLLFEKRGSAIWISHLDLMRLFQRAFKRAGLALTHTQGFNPRPSVSIALPLSVGTESFCELLDFNLESGSEIDSFSVSKLNAALVDGIRILDVYENGRKIRDLKYLHSSIVLEYDIGVPDNAKEQIIDLFAGNSLVVEKKTKRGVQQQDILTMIENVLVEIKSKHELHIDVIHCCQNPTLNPMQIPAAIAERLPLFAPDFSKCSRIEVYDEKMNVFR